MDLDLSLGPPSSGRRHPALELGFDLSLGSPAVPLAFSVSASSSSSSSSSSAEEGRAAPSAAANAMEEPPVLPHPPYLPSCASFADPHAIPPPIPAGGDSREHSPYSPSYQSLGPSYALISPLPPPRSTAIADFRGHGALYNNAAYFTILPADRGSDDGFSLHVPYEPLSPYGPEVEALVGGGGAGGVLPHVPYSSPSYVPHSMSLQDPEVAYAQRPLFGGSHDALVRDDDGSSSRPGLLDSEIQIRGLFAVQPRPWEGRFFPTSSPYGDEPPGFIPTVVDMDHSEESAEIPRKNKAGDEGVADEGPEDRNANAVNFECNICLELAKDPVVTPCGHLFCWPCLYQWLHLHCNYNECPVCKGEVTESDITPIYGRGSSQTRLEEEEDGDLRLKIPPRPRGRRSESWRQRIQRPISRRFGLEVASSWRRLFGEEVHVGNMFDVHGDPLLPQIIGVESSSMVRGSTRVGDNMESSYFRMGYPLPWRNAPSFPQSGSSSSSIYRGGFDEIWGPVSSSSLDRNGSLAAAAVGPSRFLSRTDNNANLASASATSLNTRNPGGSVPRPPVVPSRAVGQASASSTMAVIQGDVGVADAPAEPNSAGSSRNPRIRGRSNSSLYADGCPVHAFKGRRLN
ncbi:hypothetical protein Taro_008046 [Colocasia esculenta]|uniref:E3 ubiquitin-protein ligase RMA n=1 Tax=Colocasia esculenta TaxID=4460 RepID=A0A843TST3_COLES|nr:hypothetical protein [Colocasia esculenta]